MSTETVLHCAWCDGEGRCGGITVGCPGPAADSLCEDCPPVDYPTDKTRCTPCPRRVADETIDKALRDLRDFVEHGKHPGEVITVTLADATSLVEYIGDGNDALAACQAQAAGRIRELVDIGYSLVGMLEGVTQDDRDRIDVAAGITQAEWFRRQEALIERALKVLWPDGEPNPHLREPFPAKSDDDVFAEALAKIGGASP